MICSDNEKCNEVKGKITRSLPMLRNVFGKMMGKMMGENAEINAK